MSGGLMRLGRACLLAAAASASAAALPLVSIGDTPPAQAAPAAAPAPVPPASLFVAPNGDDTTCARGSAATPCASFERAFQLASSGDIVDVADGSYPAQAIGPGTQSSAVTFRAAVGAHPTVAELDINTGHVHVKNISASGSGDARGSLSVCDTECASPTDILIQNFHGKSAFIRASNVTVLGGEFGGFDACASGNSEDGFRLWGGSVVAQPENVVLNGVTIHDVGSGNGNICIGTSHEGYHVDCLQTQGGVNITIINSTFYNCPTSDIQAQPFSGAIQRDWLIQNNVFGPTACCNSIVLTQASAGGDCSTFVVRYNVINGSVNDTYCDSGPLQMYGNIFTANVSSCNHATVESYDVYVAGNSATCRGLGNRKCNPAFVNPSATPPDYTLLPTDRCARGAGDPTRFPPVDRVGRHRPQGARPDAGAYELPFVTKPKPPPKPKPKPTRKT